MRVEGLHARPARSLRRLGPSLLAGCVVMSCHQAQPSSGGKPGVPAGSTSAALAPDSSTLSAARFAQAFYDWYARQGERFEAAVRDSPAVFAPVLLQAMRADIEAQARDSQEIVGLDWDPFLATQDPCNPYRVGSSTRRGDTILVSVKGACPGMERPDTPDVVAEVGQVEGRWVFLDFRHVADSGSLLRDLAELRQSREGSRARK
jgi:hypothetical protein